MGSRYIAPSVTVSKYFQIGPEPIHFDSIVVYPPSASAGPEEPSERQAGNIGAGAENATGSGSEQPKQLVNVKLLSHEIREGMNELPLNKGDLEISSNKILPMSDQLLMHVHGGGFIATSSSTHEVCHRFVFFFFSDHLVFDSRLDLSETLGLRIRNSHCLD